MKPGNFLAHAAAGALGLLLAASAAIAAPAFTMKLSTTNTNDSNNVWLQTLKAGIEARAGDRIKVEYYPSGQLGPAPRVIEGVIMGTVEVSMNAAGFYEALNPRFGALSAPGAFTSMQSANKALNDPEIRKMFAEYGKGKGYEVLTVYVQAPLVLVAKQPYQKQEDIHGKKIRAPGSPIYLSMLRGLGAAPVSMTQGEVVPAIQNGAIDGAVGGSVIFPPLKFYDVAKPMTYLPTYIAAVSIISSQFMQAIGPELAAIVREEAYKADQYIYNLAWEDIERGRKIWEDNGGKSYTLDPKEEQRYNEVSAKATQEVLGKDPQLMKDYEMLKTFSAKYQDAK
jgi:TRAP-type C4-dicarboxylate transport system substrate-binding protein